MVNSNEIDVIVQGLIDENTKPCVESVYRFLPDARIFLATWEGEILPDEPWTKHITNVVKSSDPGNTGGGYFKCKQTDHRSKIRA